MNFAIPESILHTDDTQPELLQALIPYDAHNHEEALRLLEPLARQGNILAIFKYANTLDNLDRADEAEFYWRISLSAGHAGSCNNLANRLKDLGKFDEAYDLYLTAAESGQADAMFNIGLLLEKSDLPKAIEWFKKAVDAGHAKVCANLALHYFRDGNEELGFHYANLGISRNDGYSALSIVMHYKDLDQWDSVLEYCEIGLGLDDPLRPTWINFNQTFKTLALINLGKFDEAEAAIDDCVRLGKTAEEISDLREFLEVIRDEKESSQICFTCNAAVTETMKFCTRCGSPLK
jgi:TPR repeat protein/ribosomal protein L40E